MYKQKDGYGCGLYAVANACNLPESFITPERLEASRIPGSTNGGLSKLMQEDGFDFYMQPLFYDPNTKSLPETQTKYSVAGDVIAMPLVLCVTLSEGGLSHMIGAHLDKSGILHVYDSLKNEPFETTLDLIDLYYHSVFGIYSFCDIKNGDYAFL